MISKNPLDYFKCSFYINRHDQKKRRRYCEKVFKEMHIPAVRFQAVNGEDVSEEFFKAFKPNFTEKRTDKQIRNCAGCYQSHVLVMFEGLAAVRQHRSEALAIFEDDVEFRPDFWKLFSEWIKEVPEDWEVLSLGCLHKRKPDKVSEHVRRSYRHGSAHAYLIKAKALPIIFDIVKSNLLSADMVMKIVSKERGTVYAFSPALCGQKPFISSISGAMCRAWRREYYLDADGKNYNYYHLKGKAND